MAGIRRGYRSSLDVKKSYEDIGLLYGSGDASCRPRIYKSQDARFVGRRDRNFPSPPPRRVDGSHDGARPRMFSIYVGNLPLSADEGVLDKVFSEYGKIVDIHFPNASGQMLYKYGFVRFKSLESAELAIREMHNQDLHGNKLRVEIASESQQVRCDRKEMSLRNCHRYCWLRSEDDRDVPSRAERSGEHNVSPRNGLQPYKIDEHLLSLKLRQSFNKLQIEHEQLMKEMETKPLRNNHQSRCMRLVLDIAEITDRVQQTRQGLSDAVGRESQIPDILDGKLLGQIDQDGNMLCQRSTNSKQVFQADQDRKQLHQRDQDRNPLCRTDPDRKPLCRTDQDRKPLCRTVPDRKTLCRTDLDKKPLCHRDHDRKSPCETDQDRKNTTQVIPRPPTPIPSAVLENLHALQPNWNPKTGRKVTIGRGRRLIENNNLSQNMAASSMNGFLNPIVEDKTENMTVARH